uniref:Putative NADH dehydrogenase, transport associated n=1 Tax=Paulinella micropora TaxID=1928728 RepID=A0A385I0Y0_9EUKA|nr:putative NADH dehydrogenase, transport associated [Paulinella micropora]AXY63579.1 putative NADH dehydrogenase, transport associated [Paulinella micropora]
MSEPTLCRAPVVIVGGGFGGLYTALALSTIHDHPPILLIEPKERFIFFPLAYELLSGELQTWEVAPKYNKLFTGRRIGWLRDTVATIDIKSKTITTVLGQSQKFGQLVIATGTRLETFNIPGVREYAMTFHSLRDIERLQQLLKFVREHPDKNRRIAVVGAGPTGVELACKLADLAEGAIEIDLIERSNQLLNSSRAFNREEAQIALSKRDVRMRMETKVLKVRSDTIIMSGPDAIEEILPITKVVWTAGLLSSLPIISPNPPIDKYGCLECSEELQLSQSESIFVMGDISSVATSKQFPLPKTAQVAFQQAELVCANLIAQRKRLPLEAFHWNDLGEMISLGIGNASLVGAGLTLAGPSAFQIRRLAYLTRLPGLSHQLRVATSWMLSESY